MHLLLWMTSLDSHEFYFLLTKIMLSMSLQNFVNKFKMKKVLLSLA